MFCAAGGRYSPPLHGSCDGTHQDKKSFPVRDCGASSSRDHLESGGTLLFEEIYMFSSAKISARSCSSPIVDVLATLLVAIQCGCYRRVGGNILRTCKRVQYLTR